MVKKSLRGEKIRFFIIKISSNSLEQQKETADNFAPYLQKYHKNQKSALFYVFTNKGMGQIDPPPPSIRYQDKKCPIRSKVKETYSHVKIICSLLNK